jgi:hypothetical protein
MQVTFLARLTSAGIIFILLVNIAEFSLPYRLETLEFETEEVDTDVKAHILCKVKRKMLLRK